MESQQIKESKKRSIQYLQAQEIAWRLKSKADFIQYLDKHRKSLWKQRFPSALWHFSYFGATLPHF